MNISLKKSTYTQEQSDVMIGNNSDTRYLHSIAGFKREALEAREQFRELAAPAREAFQDTKVRRRVNGY